MKECNIISVSIIRNECDIIESFIRYNALVIDKFYILDNGSCDTTVDILKKLQSEFDIVLIEDKDSEFNQMQKVNELIRFAVKDSPSASFVMPLDGDEILYGDRIKETIISLPIDSVYFINWISMVPSSQDEIMQPFHPINFSSRRIAEFEQRKILIPSNFVKEGFLVSNGAHDFFSDAVIEKKTLSNVGLLHYPIRGIKQLQRKVVLGYINRLLSKSYSFGISSHIENMYLEFKNGKKIDFQYIKEEASKYCLYRFNQHIIVVHFIPKIIYIPLVYPELSIIQNDSDELVLLEQLALKERERLLKEAPVDNDVSEEIEKISFRKVRQEQLHRFALEEEKKLLLKLLEHAADNKYIEEAFAKDCHDNYLLIGPKEITNIFNPITKNYLATEIADETAIDFLRKHNNVLVLFIEKRNEKKIASSLQLDGFDYKTFADFLGD